MKQSISSRARSAETVVRHPYRISFAQGVGRDLALCWLNEFPGWFGPSQRSLPGKASRVNMALVTTPLGDVVANREVRRSVRGFFQSIGVQCSRSKWAFVRGLELQAINVRTPRVLACIEKVGFYFPSFACVITEYMPISRPWSYLKKQSNLQDAKQKLLDALAQTVGDMYRNGFRQPDLKEPNLLVGAKEDGDPEVWMVDLGRVARSDPPVSFDDCVRDLGMLRASFSAPLALELGITEDDWRTFSLRFLTCLHQEVPPEQDLESFLQRTAVRARARMEGMARLGKPLD